MAAAYFGSREHLLDEVALVRARALSHVGGKLPQAEIEPFSLTAEEVTARVEASLAEGVDLRLPLYESVFELSPHERAIFVTALAAKIDPLFRAVCRGLQGELAGPSLQVGTIVELVTSYLGDAVDATLLFLPERALRRFALISVEDPAPPRDLPLQALRVKIDRRVALHLLDEHRSSLPDGIEVNEPRATLPLARLSDERKQTVLKYLQESDLSGRPLLVEVEGPVGVGKKFLAEGLCAALGQRMLVARCSELFLSDKLDDASTRKAHLAEIARAVRLHGAVPYLDRYDLLLERKVHAAPPSEESSGEPQAATKVQRLPTELGDFLRDQTLCFLGTTERFEPLSDAGEVVRLQLDFPTPSQRAAIWQQTLSDLDVTLEADVDMHEIGRKLALDPARIQEAARAAQAMAAQRGAKILTRSDLVESSRHQLQHDLKSLAVRVDKAYRWEDLVITTDGYHALVEMISYSQNAETVYDTWGFGPRHSVAQGISALFAGPPGTGKTMCASVIARELDMELFRVDLSRVVSKWIGETEKNLAKVFDEAQRSHAVILFDEADSLFAKRTEVKSSVDRYANLEVNFLLQKMESFSGITILTSNLEDSIDSAFKRRLTFRIRFEKPDATARASLWQKMFPPSCELASDVDFAELGKRYEISGGNIRNAAIRAAFMAASEKHSITMETLDKATLREAREMGLLVAERSAVVPVEGEVDGEISPAEEKEAPDPDRPAPRLVPITRRR